jgi:CO/xanthine dehydrogenase FAD-binding subunit
VRDAILEGRSDSSFEALLHEAGRAAREVADPLSDARGSAEYKRDMSAVMARRAIAHAWDDALARCPGANA